MIDLIAIRARADAGRPESQTLYDDRRALLAYVDELLTLLHRTEDKKIALRIEVTDEMVTRFLWWRLPDDFQPDGGITFNRFVGCQPRPPEWWPVGTNLLTAVQAKAMLQHVLADQPSADREDV